MSTLGLNVEFRDSNQFREIIITDHQKYGTIIRKLGFSRTEAGKAGSRFLQVLDASNSGYVSPSGGS